jgi:endonuclease/exonuclease/phosphatase family metal-dependent hydrolase
MTRVLSYNILAGGETRYAGASRRSELLARMIALAQPDIVGLAEGINPTQRGEVTAIEEMAARLNMQLIRGDHPSAGDAFQVACLTRLPLVYTRVHARPGHLTRPLLEVCVREADGGELIVFVAHLIASFHRGRAAERQRRREVREILASMAPARGRPHLLMGDFNTLAPGDPLRASALLRYLVRLDEAMPYEPRDGQPHLAYVVPDRLHWLNPLLRLLPRSRLLLWLLDSVAARCVPRWSIAEIQRTGYVDCFRRMQPEEPGFTCPAIMPAGRIDFIFASPELAPRLCGCSVLSGGADVRGAQASDHLPVVADFAPVTTLAGEEERHASLSSTPVKP